MQKNSMKKTVLEYAVLLLGGLVYGFGVHFFVFSGDVVLGGTGGISVILEKFIPFSPNEIITAINLLLLVLAFVFLGRKMGVRNLVGSLATTVAIYLFGAIFPSPTPLVPNILLSGALGALIIALASALLFAADGSSGGTDIVALIVRRFSGMNIGRALFVTDILIVIVGGILLGAYAALCSAVAFLIKVVGIELLTYLIKRKRKPEREES